MSWMIKVTLLFSAIYGAFHHGVLGASVPAPGEDPCPALCEVSGSDSSNWTTYPNVERLRFCDRTMILDFSVSVSLGDSSKAHTIKACTAASSSEVRREKHRRAPLTPRADGDQSTTSTSAVELAWWNSTGSLDRLDAIAVAEEAQVWLTSATGTSLLFVYRENTAVGVWLGALVREAVMDAGLIEQFIDHVDSDAPTSSTLIQVCGRDLGADYSFGMVAATGDSRLELAQDAVKTWIHSTCVTGTDGSASLGNITFSSIPPTKVARSPSRFAPRAPCSTITVGAGDSCWSLSQRCGISLETFQSYNPGSSFCSSLQPDQPVCCTSGTLPTPTPNPDGSCASYTVQSGDWCAKIAAGNAISISDLEDWNEDTWGWLTCNNLQVGTNICISTGTPPMPAPVANAECGPTVPGTTMPGSGVSLADLNPCPLNSCCNFWGHCGTTAEFCTPAGDGVPVTQGCISNCGTDIISSPPPAQFKRLAYFAGFNPNRKCLKMDISQIDESKYTHIHFAFIDLTHSYQIDTSSTQYQWERFRDLETSMKKIVSFGGWTFSAEAPNYDIFRLGMLPANRETLANSIANFVNSNNLDGVDIDWEYPGAPDLPGIPPGSPDDGPNYLAFLALLRTKLAPGKSLSIAAPASFWYLKPFPIEEMGEILDYIVFMTYDLHGQWDYESIWASPGCDGGSCLRSHVNLTETLNALSMITKAGVPSNKILVGVSSYGRSFGMATPGCTGPMCKFTGPESGAAKGICTDTAGYIANAEISQIIQTGAPGLQQFGDDSDSDILVYGNTWVAYMSDERKASRTDLYRDLGFGGISDWSVDLQEFQSPPGGGCSQHEGEHIVQAWREAGEIAWVHWQWSPKGKWQNAMDLYLGEGTRNDYDFWGDPGPVGMNIGKEYMIHFSGWLEHPINTWSYWYCHEEDVPGYDANNPECGPNTAAYTWDDPGHLWSAHYVVLCPQWWNFSRTMSLNEAVVRADGDINYQMTMENWRPIRARTVLHETYHWEYTVSEPRCRDLAYSPTNVVNLARNEGTNRARLNAESFAQAGMAIFIMDTWHHDTPPTPGGVPYPPGPATDLEVDGLVEVSLDGPPSGWVRPVSLDSLWPEPDPSLGAQSLSSFGTLEGHHNGDCLEGSEFWTMAQCSVYCQYADCNKRQNGDGQDVYRCENCSGGGYCADGPYPNQLECENGCVGGTCTSQPGYKDIICSGCPEQECTDGTYDDFNECGDNCHQGMCSQSAGVPGVTCTCP
ncbi:Killer toxin subunits alpha/beta [Madurella mycetomatis]|uniref:chitinase n=1 Tax=Madurella mycetomatis TaxID=100816 RepID=A0A175VW46_9PEZI|nr:Killer toxin subunits alpha/beta [Madurella mycetomatis]